MQSAIQKTLNASSIFNGIPIPVQATPVQTFNAFKNARNASYISYLGWNSYTGSSVECL
jgi:hypothetical protein